MDPITIGLGLIKFAPMIGGWLFGDKGEEAAKKVVKIAEQVTGKKGAAAEKAINASPELAMKFKTAVLDQQIKLDKLYLADRQDARERDLKLRELGYRNVRADIMILVVGVALCLDMWLLWANPSMPSGVVAIFNIVVGALLQMLNAAFNFEFGSSRGSKEKDLK